MHALCFNRVSYAGKRVSSEAKPLPRGVGATLELTWSFARLSLRHFFHLRARLPLLPARLELRLSRPPGAFSAQNQR